MKKTIKMTKGDVMMMHHHCTSVTGTMNKNYIEFSLRNKKVLDVEKEIVDKAFERTQEEQEYIQKEWGVISQYAKKKDGQVMYPIQIDTENLDVFNEKLAEIKSEHQEIFDSITRKKKEEDEEMTKEIELDLHTIEFKYLPDEMDSNYYQFLRDSDLVEMGEE